MNSGNFIATLHEKYIALGKAHAGAINEKPFSYGRSIKTSFQELYKCYMELGNNLLSPADLENENAIQLLLLARYITHFCEQRIINWHSDTFAAMSNDIFKSNTHEVLNKMLPLENKIKDALNHQLAKEIADFFLGIMRLMPKIGSDLDEIEGKEEAIEYMLSIIVLQLKIGKLDAENLYIPMLIADVLETCFPEAIRNEVKITYQHITEEKRLKVELNVKSVQDNNILISPKVDSVLFYIGATLAIGLTLGFVIPVYYLIQSKRLDKIERFFNSLISYPTETVVEPTQNKRLL